MIGGIILGLLISWIIGIGYVVCCAELCDGYGYELAVKAPTKEASLTIFTLIVVFFPLFFLLRVPVWIYKGRKPLFVLGRGLRDIFRGVYDLMPKRKAKLPKARLL